MKYAYYPGCSIKGTGRAYEESLLPVLKALDVEFEEIDDWNCCGATAYMAVDEIKSCVLASRNLALAEKGGYSEMMAPCSACYLVLNKAQRYIETSGSVADTVKKALGAINLKITKKIKVRHPLDILLNDVGLDRIKQKVKRPLTGLKVATYYGCQIVRPYSTFDDQYNPTSMDKLIKALGATVVNFPLKTRCCGGSLTGTLPEPGLLCAYILLKEAMKRGADVISTACSLCQFNLDGYQDKIAKKWEPVQVPALYFTQLMGLAFGFSEEEMGLHRCIVPFSLENVLNKEAVAS
ncbi:MAG: CoB--CoM heterodisulfide reductase iron-sulfur subunit B family protein [Verrucomicrobiia bacterium]